MEVVKARAEKRSGLLECLHAPLHKQAGKHLVDTHFRREPVHFRPVGRLLYYPLAVLSHIRAKLIIYFRIL